MAQSWLNENSKIFNPSFLLTGENKFDDYQSSTKMD